MAWALATAKQLDTALLRVSATVAERLVCEFNVQELHRANGFAMVPW